MQTVLVLGAGFMGSGIAQVCATGGYRTLLMDVSSELAQKGWNSIAAGLEKQVARGKLSQQDMDGIMSRLTPCADMEQAGSADFVLEAVIENEDVKKAAYARLEKYCAPDAIIGTNTSFIPITRLAEGLERPERFVGMHFFGPVYAMKLLEVIRGKKTSDATMVKACEFGVSIGKECVRVEVDTPGFIVNRINFATYAEAYRVMQEGVASIEDIDKAMRLGLNHPVGPFELNDIGSLKTVQDCLATLYSLTGDERYLPVKELDEHVAKGELGKKFGKGWYDYTK